jgi:hypothetical protein
LIKYLENETAPSTFIDIGHPWAQSPKTIGSIATMYMSILFMRELLPEEDGYEE